MGIYQEEIMKANIYECINKFMDCVINKYGDRLSLGYYHDSDEDVYVIWHDNFDMQSSDLEFQRVVGSYYKEFFIDNEFYNVTFGYDLERANNKYNHVLNQYANFSFEEHREADINTKAYINSNPAANLTSNGVQISLNGMDYKERYHFSVPYINQEFTVNTDKRCLLVA